VLDNTRFLYLNPGEVEVYPRLRLFNFIDMIDMKIINTKIENNILTITLDSASSVTKVYLDNVLNKKNMYSENDEDHNHVVNSPNISDNTITIDITEYDSTSFIVNVVGSNNAVSIAID
jgi:hypothetical protein